MSKQHFPTSIKVIPFHATKRFGKFNSCLVFFKGRLQPLLRRVQVLESSSRSPCSIPPVGHQQNLISIKQQWGVSIKPDSQILKLSQLSAPTNTHKSTASKLEACLMSHADQERLRSLSRFRHSNQISGSLFPCKNLPDPSNNSLELFPRRLNCKLGTPVWKLFYPTARHQKLASFHHITKKSGFVGERNLIWWLLEPKAISSHKKVTRKRK